jgi:hypothetical protein
VVDESVGKQSTRGVDLVDLLGEKARTMSGGATGQKMGTTKQPVTVCLRKAVKRGGLTLLWQS